MPQDNKRVKLLAALALFITAVIYFITQGDGANATGTARQTSGSQLTFAETGAAITYNFDSAASFYSFGTENFYFCTRDGVKFMNGKGEPVWGDVFTMTAPVLVGGGKYVIVGEPKGNVVYLYGPEGRLYTNQFDGSIMYFTVNESGYAAVTIKLDQHYETRMFNAEGKELPIFVHQDANVFPVCADISQDGRMVAFSMLDINGAYMTSHIVCQYLGSEANNYADGIFAAEFRERQIVAALKFAKDNMLFGFSDTGAFCVPLGAENPMDSLTDIGLSNKIEQMGFFGGNGFVLALGDEFTDKEGAAAGTLKFYDALGSETGAFDLERKATYLSCAGGNVIVGAGRTFYAFSAKGKLLWQYSGTQDYKQAVFLENSDTVLFATNTEAVIMKRGK